PAVLGDEDAAAGQRPGIDGPLHVGDLPALLAVGAALPDSSAAASRAIQLANQRKPEERLVCGQPAPVGLRLVGCPPTLPRLPTREPADRVVSERDRRTLLAGQSGKEGPG